MDHVYRTFPGVSEIGDSVVCIATGCGMDGRGSNLGRGKSFVHNVQTGSGAHPASYQMGIKRPGREADHSPPSSAEVKNGGALPPLPHMSSWHST
jgi:hypothetical protein